MRLKRVAALILLSLIILGLGLLGWTFLVEPNRLVVHNVDIVVAGLPHESAGFRIVAIGDIHAGSNFINAAKLAQIVALANAQDADIIVLLGDFVTGNQRRQPSMPAEVVAQGLKGLHARYGVFAVLGNHDWWTDGERLRSALQAAGINVLESEAARLDVAGGSIWLLGVPDLWTRQPIDLRSALKSIDQPGPIIALTHNPDIFPDLPANIPLTLAAHTHGGQVRFPLIGAPIVSVQHKQYTRGLVAEAGRQMFVTTGIGTSGLPVRFGVPPEIAVITLH